MPDAELQDLIARILSDPACSVSPALRPHALPDSLPADVRHFYAQCSGGRLYCDPAHPTPQFGCVLGFTEQPVARQLPCEGVEFDCFYVVADFDEGEHDCIVVSTHPDTYGYIYRLNYSLGDPDLSAADAHFLAPTFTRWLAMHVDAWSVYLDDWREGLKHFGRLIERARNAQSHH